MYLCKNIIKGVISITPLILLPTDTRIGKVVHQCVCVCVCGGGGGGGVGGGVTAESLWKALKCATQVFLCQSNSHYIQYLSFIS